MGELQDAFFAKGPEPGFVEGADAGNRFSEGVDPAEYVAFTEEARLNVREVTQESEG
jgi:hypothetical protein